MFKKVCLFTGNANPGLAASIGQYLETPIGKCRVTRFSDGESFVEIGENVRGVDAFVVQPTCPPDNDNVMELLIMVDALRRASAGSITAVMPYYGYAPAGSQGGAAHAHHEQARGGSHRRPPASTASCRSICTPGRSRGSSTSPSITSTRCPSSSRTT